MMRRLAMAGLAAVAAATLVSAGVAQGAPLGSDVRTLRLFERDTQQASIDLGDRGPGLGDLFVFSGDLTDTTATGRKLGRADGSCTTTSGDATTPGSLLCAITFTLRGGQIETQAVFDSAALFGGTAQPLAITGGTGEYRDAHGDGTGQVPDVNDPSTAMFVLKLA